MSPDDLARLLSFFKVLANESRLKILALLAHEERSVEELATRLQLKAPTVSHHLSRLRELGMVSMRAEGNTHYYRMDEAGLARLNKEVLSADRVASLMPQGEGRFARKVLDTYFDGDRLVSIPASRKKRRVIIEWLVERFEVGVRYPEREVNEIIQRHHWDSASLRREMIAYGLMAREAQVYWRLPQPGGDPDPATEEGGEG